jgi:hypothetical protein
MSATATAPGTRYAGPWFMSPSFEAELERRDLEAADEEMVRRFARDGYLLLDDVGLSDFEGLVDRANRGLDELHEGGAFNRVAEGWSVVPEVRRLATAPRVKRVLELLYGRRPIPWHTLNFYRGTQQATHSDAVHFHSFPKHYMCGVWVAFEDTDDRNGALHVYPGSHLLPDVEYADLGLEPGKDFYPHYEAYVRELIEGRGLRKEKAFMHKGQALIWAANLLHGGDPISDPESTRRSQVTHYFFEDCSYYVPLRSDLARGRVFFRQITDIETGRLVPARVGGRRVPISPVRRAAAAQRWLRHRLGRGASRFPG